VSDDGLPSPPGTTTHTWSQVSGPGSVGFADAAGLATSATFSSPGSYVLRLTASDSLLTAFDELTVSLPPPLTADAGPNPPAGSEGGTSTFMGSAAGGLPPLAYTWNFGDGSTGSGAMPTHIYADNGTYTATLTVLDAAGQTAQDTAITAVANVAPLVTTPAAVGGFVGEPVVFGAVVTDPSTVDTAAGLSVSWDFGDGGAPGSGTTTTHVYAAAGTYDVGVTARDKDGGTSLATATAAISDAPPPGSCLDAPVGSVLTVSGAQTVEFNDTALLAGTTVDARTASWTALGSNPVKFGGGSGICWSDGNIEGDYPPNATWDTTHSTEAVKTIGLGVTVENVRAVTYGDGIQLYQGTDNFTVRGAYLHDIRDDCIEGDWLPGGVIEDSLLDGCYEAFAARPRSSDAISDGSGKTWVIRNVLAYVRPQIGVYKGASPGNGAFFKWDTSLTQRSPKVAIHDTILRIDQYPNHTEEGLWVQDGKLESCSNVTIVWLGPGPYPVPVPPCVTVTTDVSVWDAAVVDWQARHNMGFLFAAAGDHGANSDTDASLAALDASKVDFYLALGDLDYDQTPTDAAWCDYVKARLPTLGPSFPFELVSGNHEEQGGSNGYILNHAACLPDRLNSRLGPDDLYAVEYYFDYPTSSPLARVIMIAPDLTVENVKYDYLQGDVHYNWLAGAVDDARALGIPWVVVGMHKVCFEAGARSCELSRALVDLLISKKVDLVLQGHDHHYERSKQLAMNPATCPTVPDGAFDADCVVDDGADAAYVKGAGTVFVIDGTFGQGLHAINPSDPEYPYFAKTDATSWGFTKYAVTADRIDARFVASVGTFSDVFAIVNSGINTPPVVSAGPDQQVMQPNAATLSGTVNDDGLPSPPQLTHQWAQVSGPGTASFADAAALTTTVTFSDPGTYVLRLTASDSALTASDEVTVTVVAQAASFLLDIRVAASSDDAEEAVSSGAVSRSSSDLELTTDGSTEQTVGMRFGGVSVPPGATVTRAYVQFEVDEVSTGACSLLFRGQAADNAGTFLNTTFGVSSRPRTTATVAWTPPLWPTIQVAGPDQRTPDLSAVLQELVNRPGWASGNALAIIVTGTGRRTAEAFDGTAAPVLHIEYVVN
jgi:PKD repeat protein